MDENNVKEIIRQWFSKNLSIEQIIPEYSLIPGGLVADFVTRQSDGRILHIIECKGSVDMGEIAKGLGQCFQYLFQCQMNKESNEAEIIFVCPEDRESILKVMKIPDNVKVLYISSRKEIYERRISKTSDKLSLELQIPGTFYIRDIMLADYVTIFEKIDNLSYNTKGSISKEDIVSDLNETQATAYKNFLITFRTLGFVDSNNHFTPEGYKLLGILKQSRNEFYKELTRIYYPLFLNILNALIHISIKNNDSLNNINCTHKDISNAFQEIWGSDVRFMKDHQTISTLMRNLEELMCIKKIGKGGSYKINSMIHPDYLPWLLGRIDKY